MPSFKRNRQKTSIILKPIPCLTLGIVISCITWYTSKTFDFILGWNDLYLDMDLLESKLNARNGTTVYFLAGHIESKEEIFDGTKEPNQSEVNAKNGTGMYIVADHIENKNEISNGTNAAKQSIIQHDANPKEIISASKLTNKSVTRESSPEINSTTMTIVNKGSKQPPGTTSFSNCTDEMKKEKNFGNVNTIIESYSGTLQITCRWINYLAPTLSFQKSGSIIIGVLSSASKDGPARRKSIRKTWAKNRNGVFFLVAGPWKEIRDEYNEKGDLIWIDEDEIYNAEESVLTLKSYSFLSIVHILTEKLDLNYSHVFKTDDDSYLDFDGLYKELAMTETDGNVTRVRGYVGKCQMKKHPVVRDGSFKWPLTTKTYPEKHFPKYCQGAGYAVSQKFINCAHTQKHIANVRFMPLEDVAVGILAEKCGISPSLTVTGEIKLSRYDSQEARDRIKKNNSTRDDLIPIAACMTERILQHRVIDAYDMKQLHRTVLDPKYCKITRRMRGKQIYDMEKDNKTWYG